MAIPLIGLANILLRATLAALSAYEVYQYGKDIYDKGSKFKDILEEAKKKLKPAIENMQKELNKGTAYGEALFLHQATNADKGGNISKKKTSRFEQQYEEYIRTRIPYRDLISQICEMADKNGVPQLRKKPKLTVKDLGLKKAKILALWAGMLLEEITDKDLGDEFLICKLKQFAASIMFEYVDDILYWKSPLKTEVTFGPKFQDPKYDPNIPLKLLRNDSDINPFYPSPYGKRKGSFSTDIVIPETRLAEISKTNVFAIIEIKFENDTAKKEQMKLYSDFLKASKEAKEIKYGRFNNLSKTGMIHGGKLALFRYPEDSTNYQESKIQQSPQNPRRQH